LRKSPYLSKICANLKIEQLHAKAYCTGECARTSITHDK